MRTIKKGDWVEIHWSDGTIDENCIVNHVSEWPGDMWYVTMKDKATMAVNSQSAQLNVIIKMHEGRQNVLKNQEKIREALDRKREGDAVPVSDSSEKGSQEIGRSRL